MTELLLRAAAASRSSLIAIDNGGFIVGLLPDAPVLGRPAAELVGKSLAEVLDIHRLAPGTRFLRNSSDRLTAVRIEIGPLSAVQAQLFAGAAGTPPAVQVVVVTEVPEAGLLLEAADNQSSASLADANRVLSQQAVEMQSAILTLEQRNREIVDELTLAADLQKSILPTKFPQDLPVTFAHKYLPYAYIGGDFFDVIRIDAQHVGVIMADVSGHGVPAAFITAIFKRAFTLHAGDTCSPAEALALLNSDLCGSMHTDHYVTAFYTVLDLDSLQLTYCSAGHPKQLLYHADGTVDELSSEGFFLGMFETTKYEEGTVQLRPGDRLLYCTDGILEVIGDGGAQFGRENLNRVVQEHAAADIDSLSAFILSELISYMEGDAFDDDITLLIAEVADVVEAVEVVEMVEQSEPVDAAKRTAPLAAES